MEGRAGIYAVFNISKHCLKDYITDMQSHSYTELLHAIVIITCEIEILVITKLYNWVHFPELYQHMLPYSVK